MSRNAITVENLSKAYRIGLKQERADSLIGLAQQTLTAPFRNFRQLRRLDTLQHQDDAPDLFWALNDVSFEVPEGEVLGVIGRNGAGKSTLLKILSRITEPTAGRVVIRGRVASLLEVGTGFHPDLSGRDNIYMNGTILGMRKREIDQKLDQIVDFSGVEKFLDTPVKRYSSGMRVRLGFAVAAHLDPEILIVDEVLAVGDATFQNKCLLRMEDIAREGRTVLFVSHSLDMIDRLCTTGVLLEHGKIVDRGPASAVISKYLTLGKSLHQLSDLTSRTRTGNGSGRFETLELLNGMDEAFTHHVTGDPLKVVMSVLADEPLSDAAISIILTSPSGARVMSGWTRESGMKLNLTPGRHRVVCTFDSVPLRPGHELWISLWLESRGQVIDYVQSAACFSARPADDYSAFLSTDRSQGPVVTPQNWTVERHA